MYHGVLVERYSESIYSGVIHGSIHGSDLPKTSSGHPLTSSASHAVGGGVGGGVQYGVYMLYSIVLLCGLHHR